MGVSKKYVNKWADESAGFVGSSFVYRINGAKAKVSELKVGDEILGYRLPTAKGKRIEISVETVKSISNDEKTIFKSIKVGGKISFFPIQQKIQVRKSYGVKSVFASDIKLGDTVYLLNGTGVKKANVEESIEFSSDGPQSLFNISTTNGTIIVNDILVNANNQLNMIEV